MLRAGGRGGLRDGTVRCVVYVQSRSGRRLPAVDQVLQIGSPKGVARLLQRAGRSGHQPGGRSRCCAFQRTRSN